MKQTNSARNFLLAQYRATFKHAYTQSLRTALVLCISLASASNASAASDTSLDSQSKWQSIISDPGAIIEITGKDEDKGANGHFKNINLAGSVDGLTLQLEKQQKLVISDSISPASDNKLSANEASSKLFIKGSGEIEIAARNNAAVAGHGLTVEASSGGTVGIDVSKLDIQADLVLKTTGSALDSMVSVAANSISIGDGKLVGRADSTQYDRANVVIGDSNTLGSVLLGHRQSIYNVQKDGSIVVNASSGGSTIYGKSMTIDGGSLTLSANEPKYKAYYKIKHTDVNDGYFNIQSVKSQNRTTADLELGVTGELALNGKSTLTASGAMAIKQGTVKLGRDATLAAVNEGALINLTGTSIANGVLHVHGETLSAFLSGMDSRAGSATPLKYKTDAFASEVNAAAGAISIQRYGKLTFADNTDLASFSYARTGKKAGQITVEVDGVIAGKDLTVSRSLGTEVQRNLIVEASNLTLGSEGFDSSSEELGAEEFVTENVKFVNRSGERVFTLKDMLKLKSSSNGQILGENIDVNGGSLYITEGNYTFGNILTVSLGDPTNSRVGMHISNARLNLTGELETVDGNNGYIELSNAGVLDASQAKAYDLRSHTVYLKGLSNLILDGTKVVHDGKTSETSVAFHKDFDYDAVSGSPASTLTLKGLKPLNVKQFESLQAQTDFKGFITGIDIAGVDTSKQFLTMGSDTVLSGTPDEIYHNAQVKVPSTVDKAYSFGSVLLSSDAPLTVGGTDGAMLKLTNAAANNNDKQLFVQNASGKPGDVILTGTKAWMQLVGTGTLGTVQSAGQRNGRLIIGDKLQQKTGNVTLTGDVGSSSNILEEVRLFQGSTLSLAEGTSVHSHHLFLMPNATVNAQSASINIKHVGNQHSESKILGNIVAKELSFSGLGTHSIAGNAHVKVNSLKVNDSAKIILGDDKALGGTLIADNLSLSKGLIFVDPKFGNEASYLVVNELSGNSKDELDGKIIVGQNAVAAIGFSSKDEVKDNVRNYIDSNGSFYNKGAIRHALVLNKPITVGSNSGIAISAAKANTPNDTFIFGPHAALILTDKVQLSSTEAAIKMTGTTAGSNTIDTSNGGVVILSGRFHESQSPISIFGSTTAVKASLTNEIKIRSANGFLSGTIDKDGNASEGVKLDKDKLKAQLALVSEPIRQLHLQVLGEDSDKVYSDDQEDAKAGAAWVANLSTNSSTGIEMDSVAHAATYAGAHHAAIAASSTIVEAISSRIGTTIIDGSYVNKHQLGNESSVIAATGSLAGGGLWLTPMYKSITSDGFDAQGALYGTDVDLAGVTLGADTVFGNLRLGAAFNIGTGDANGYCNGNGLKDEFDYYGIGFYAGMEFSNISVIADASYSVVSHAIEGYSGIREYGNLSASADTKAFSVGVTAQHTFFTNFADLTPHASVRYTRLDTEGYDMNTAMGVIGTTDFDVQNLFSLPVGITISKTFESHGWDFTPHADINMCFNVGDTQSSSEVHFKGMTTNYDLEAEVMDEFSYGLDLGFSAHNGDFGTSLSFGYSGSSHTDSVSCNVNVHYMF